MSLIHKVTLLLVILFSNKMKLFPVTSLLHVTSFILRATLLLKFLVTLFSHKVTLTEYDIIALCGVITTYDVIN